jgi:8-amino-7-oxononanoate synthase
VADWLATDASLAFSSGYAANTGLLGAVAGPDDLVVSDALNHASIIDGIRLSRARIAVVPHCDAESVCRALRQRRERRAFVVTETYFSMDADSPDLRALRQICDELDAALVVDEAHALGVLGPSGRGLAAEAGIQADALVGTFGKAFGVAGAFVAGSSTLIQWLWNRARSFVFSTGLSPVVASAALESLMVALETPALRETARHRAQALRDGMERVGAEPSGYGHIVPWIIGDVRDALRLAAGLRARGIHALAVRPPSIPYGTARLRLTSTAAHSREDIERAIAAIGAVLG